MSVNRQAQIHALHLTNCVIVEPGPSRDNKLSALSVSAEIMNLGFVPSKSLFSYLCMYTGDQLKQMADDITFTLKQSIGAHVVHKPMYPNFPQQVMEASEAELFFNAMFHYWTHGEWMPTYKKLPRGKKIDARKLKQVGVITQDQFLNCFTDILSSKDSIPPQQVDAVRFFLDAYSEEQVVYPTSIPFKETQALVASILIGKGRSISFLNLNTTDILRVAVALSGGDVSLATPTKFRNFKRSERKVLIEALEQTAKAEDLTRHAGMWVRLFHQLHVGEYSNKLFELARVVRENEKVWTFNSRVESLIATKKWADATQLLASRPGEFSRRVCDMLRKTYGKNRTAVTNSFVGIVDDVPTRNLLQLYGALTQYSDDQTQMMVSPKGAIAKTVIVPIEYEALDAKSVVKIKNAINESLSSRFSKLPELGKVYVDPSLKGAVVPAGLRSASDNSRMLARGTRFPLDNDKSTIRLFCYWVGQDIDLSACLYDANLNHVEDLSYYNLYSDFGCHSGDITRAPNGASEFIDLNIEKAKAMGGRYIVVDLRVYSGPLFGDHETCFVGWMMRDKPNSNEIYDPKTVVGKSDVKSMSSTCTPVIFDLQTREAIWVDVSSQMRNYSYGGWNVNNAAVNRASVRDVLQMYISYSDNRFNLYDLFTLHANARGTMVDDPKDADVVYSFDGDITPYDILKINSEYLQ